MTHGTSLLSQFFTWDFTKDNPEVGEYFTGIQLPKNSSIVTGYLLPIVPITGTGFMSIGTVNNNVLIMPAFTQTLPSIKKFWEILNTVQMDDTLNVNFYITSSPIMSGSFHCIIMYAII